MGIQNDLKELLEAKVISAETAESIVHYYGKRDGANQNRLLVAFGILGSILVGLGIMLIVAHNWDQFDRTTKTFWAFLPLVVGQAFAFYALYRKNQNVAWKEGSSTFLFFASGVSISLVSQIYHIPGELKSFLLTWMLLGLPLIYIMKSSMVSLLYIAGITWYAVEAGYNGNGSQDSYYYWILLVVAIPQYVLMYLRNPSSNFLTFHHWFVPLSLSIVLGTIANHQENWIVLCYVILFSLFSIVGEMSWINSRSTIVNGYAVLGSLGIIFLLTVNSFSFFWEDLIRDEHNMVFSPEPIVSAAMFIAAIILLRHLLARRNLMEVRPESLSFLAFVVVFMVGFVSSYAVVLDNLLLLTIGVLLMRRGSKQNHLGILNYGMLIIALLVICRFFDTNLSFVIRGLLFVAVGTGFFITNYLMLKRRRQHE